ncbi:DinB family protein [Bacillus sp. SCS-153A]|uniref:DinB family protein n=1 Tax=Rossellomorea sedimentorum TaxID=3115294 RepID=UPI0039062034
MIDYRIKSVEGFTEKIGELVSMLEHTRAVTLEEIKGLSQGELDYRVDQDANSIGALLLHIASIEYVHQVVSFEGRDLNAEELERWKTALELGENAKAIQNHPVEIYLKELSHVRENTIRQLKQLNDEWLLQEKEWGHGVPYNHYYLWFHVFEDEINHRGQIRAIKRQLLHG